MPWLIPIPCHVVGDLGSLPLAASDVAVSALGRHSKSTSSARTGSHSFCSPICARPRRGGSASCPSCCMPRCHGAHACTPRVSFSPCMQGRVVNIGSVAGLIATPLASTYSATKFALEALTDALRREVHLSVPEYDYPYPEHIHSPLRRSSVSLARLPVHTAAPRVGARTGRVCLDGQPSVRLSTHTASRVPPLGL